MFKGNNKQKIIYWLTSLIIAILPVLVTIILVRLLFASSLQNFAPQNCPSNCNDFVEYWHQARTFHYVGFEGGYYGPNEQVSPLEFIRFGVHGPTYAMLYGSLSRIVGWQINTPIYINFFLLAVGILFFIFVTQPSYRQLLLIGLVVLTFWSISKYTAVTSQESINQAAAFIIAAFFYIFLTKRENTPWKISVCFYFFLMIISLARSSWSFLFIPFLLLITPRKLKSQIISFTLGVLNIPIILYIISITTTPGIDTISDMIRGFSVSPQKGIAEGLDILYDNYLLFVQYFFSLNTAIFIEVFCLIIFLFIVLVFRSKVNKDNPDRNKPFYLEENLFHIFNLAIIWFTSLIIYFLYGADRVLGMHLLLSLLLFIKFDHKIIVLGILIFHLLLFPLFIKEYRQEWGVFYTNNQQKFVLLSQKFHQHLEYNSNVTNPWCNTTFIPLRFYNYRAALIPAGYGISFYYPSGSLAMPLKSQYVFINNEALKRISQRGILHLELLEKYPFGKLFRNLDSACH